MAEELKRIRLKLKPLPPDRQQLVDIIACVEAARAKCLPLKDRDAYLSDLTNSLEVISRKARLKHVRDFTQAFSVRLMEMGH